MLARGLPWSFALHLVALTLLVFYGNHVARAPVQPPRSINVQLVQMPQTRPVQEDPAPVVAESRPVETAPDSPPKELPKPKPEQKPVEKKPEPRVEQPRDDPPADETPAEQPAVQSAVASPAVTSTDSDFPFAWYISMIESKIVGNWQRREVSFGNRSVISCTIHFNILRNGRVAQVTLESSSGIGVCDRDALRAVQTVKLPPLPPDYRASELGVTFVFNQESGM